jgi:hypothetical protein
MSDDETLLASVTSGFLERLLLVEDIITEILITEKNLFKCPK